MPLIHFVDETQELEALYWSEHGSPPPQPQAQLQLHPPAALQPQLAPAEGRRVPLPATHPDPGSSLSSSALLVDLEQQRRREQRQPDDAASASPALIIDSHSRDHRDARLLVPSPHSQPASTPAASWREVQVQTPTTLPSVYSAIPSGSTLGLANFEHHDDVVFPFTQPHEVRLMKYYLEYMCTWFDLCDARRHFAIVVPRRATTCPTLLNAIFALSSRHLSLHEQYDPYASDRYHQECLKHLTTISNDSSALTNDDLLAATILLRTLEELDVPLIGTDHEGHLLGIQLFMNTQNASALDPPSSLRQASFWVGLRQEITMAFATQRPIKVKLDHLFIDRSFSPTDDDCWANRIVVHCAEVVQFCFGEVENRKSEYQRLVEYDYNWLRARPLSWLPIAYSEPDLASGLVFPQIFYINHAVVIGNVHGALARALLMCHDESIPKIGPSRIRARKKLDNDIRMQVRELCGAALSNKQTIPAMFTACMGVTACGDRFVEYAEQKALLDILVKTDVEHMWPTASAQSHLKRAWGWEDDS
ncbi:hypothetical protein CABS02_00129 [Colletotrichum abscissum]|uniref:Arca-like protein n=1 Tax=Colletotrichum abscissum TaxID=1671311 RepID=A0A9P9XS73_9PEZI|nr:hypothetical protein CABS02_00129 [Colletotrichum abscissum]